MFFYQRSAVADFSDEDTAGDVTFILPNGLFISDAGDLISSVRTSSLLKLPAFEHLKYLRLKCSFSGSFLSLHSLPFSKINISESFVVQCDGTANALPCIKLRSLVVPPLAFVILCIDLKCSWFPIFLTSSQNGFSKLPFLVIRLILTVHQQSFIYKRAVNAICTATFSVTLSVQGIAETFSFRGKTFFDI